jgi:hypothetical protein
MAVYKDTTQPVELRLEAARAAIGYEKPRLAAVNANVSGGLTLAELVLASMKLREGGAAVTRQVKMGYQRDFEHRSDSMGASSGVSVGAGCRRGTSLTG